MNSRVLFLCLFPFAFFPACKKNIPDGFTQWHSKHIEAKLYDIPVLLNAQLIRNEDDTTCDEESSIITYEVPIHHKEAVIFYQEEMERLGWWQSVAFQGAETLLNFEKPNKQCSISIRPLLKINRCSVLIFLKQRAH